MSEEYITMRQALEADLRDARKLADSAMLEADRYRGALKKIASMDTSQDASPQQCGAVLIAMNVLENIR